MALNDDYIYKKRKYRRVNIMNIKNSINMHQMIKTFLVLLSAILTFCCFITLVEAVSEIYQFLLQFILIYFLSRIKFIRIYYLNSILLRIHPSVASFIKDDAGFRK